MNKRFRVCRKSGPHPENMEGLPVEKTMFTLSGKIGDVTGLS